MSFRAWLVRRTIYSIFKKPVKDAPLDVRMAHFAKALDKITSGKTFDPAGKAEITPAEGYPGKSEWVTARGVDASAAATPTIFYCHGGAYVWGSPREFREFGWRLSAACGARVLLVDYPLAPAETAPHVGDAALQAYRRLLADVDPAQIVMAGDSAGGGLTMTLALRLKAADLPQPAGIMLLSPWLDLTGSGQSVADNAAKDVMIDAESLAVKGKAYAGALDTADPEVSPLFGDLAALAPIFVQVGSTEVLRDDSTRLAARVREAGGDIVCDVWRNMHHDFQMSAGVMPEARRALRDLGDFVREKTCLQTGSDTRSGAGHPKGRVA